ncbi:hypothetical protein OOK58_58880 [Streptomyces sp. NBC_01728]|uniref:hypothetical protein n=1 Tax=unclassified Streptomyces TaxID=2593676 RepID=UPI002256C851|nr:MULTISPECIES: hypothetical protein [unclassified Streptomyces]MCX4462374.1 hypothetical protein [Streptomyces sp. NBC_01719]MCX4500804.1 hypothetical protein [Streptomyces sp. NBC_01728]
MPATVWILIPPYKDGPYELLRTGWITRVEQNEEREVIVHDTRNDSFIVARGSSRTPEVPVDFGTQLLQALDAARRAAQEVDSDRVVAARYGEDSWSWEAYALDEVPPAQAEPPLYDPPTPGQVRLPPPPGGSFVPNPNGSMPLWAPAKTAEAETGATTE